MAKGQKYNEEIKERAWAMFSVYGNISYIARRLGVPRGTVFGWKKEFEKNKHCKDELEQLRQAKKQEFIVRAWQSINLAQTILEKRLDRAVKHEAEIDEMIDLVYDIANEKEMDEKKRDALIAKIYALKCEDIGKLTSVVSLLYDKQALASCEPTEIVEGAVKRFEDFAEDGEET